MTAADESAVLTPTALSGLHTAYQARTPELRRLLPDVEARRPVLAYLPGEDADLTTYDLIERPATATEDPS